MITTLGDIDKNRIRQPLGRIVLLELVPQTTRLNPDDRFRARVEVRPPVEDIHAKQVFLQPISVLCERLFDDVTQQSRQTRCVRKRSAAEYQTQLRTNG